MKVCFSPAERSGLEDQARLNELVAHLQRREVEVVDFIETMEVDGVVVELTAMHAGTYGHALYAAKQLEKPVLALYNHLPVRANIQELHEHPKVRVVRYSQLFVAKSGLDMFLETYCGYRVPLDATEDRLVRPEAADRLQ